MRDCNSPELRSMNKDPTSTGNSGAYTSPSSPDHDNNHNKRFQKESCSERTPLSCNNSKQKRISVNVLSPFSNGKTIPSKWDDAERWITSPVSGSGSGICKTLAPLPRRRPKSKSGPLGSNPCYTSNVSDGSALTTGVMVPVGYSFGTTDAMDSSELFIEPLYLDSQDEKIDGNSGSCVGSRRDMATQMSPMDSPIAEPNIHDSARVEVRDVQVDKRVTMTKQLKKHKKKMENIESTDHLALTWNPTEGAMDLSKFQKEEARITAWENLQIAKAEASIRKLEMKLEKKKSDSMDKIMNKLRIARMKAEEMRKRMSANEAPKTSLHINPKIFLVGCFCFKQF